jgi:hypothetical protein
MELILKIELPESLTKALELWCKNFTQKPDIDCQIGVIGRGEKEKPKEKPEEKLKEKLKEKPEEKPEEKPIESLSDEVFGKLGLPSMEACLANPENFNSFRVRAFARKARETYGDKVKDLADSMDPNGFKGIIKNKIQSALFVTRIRNKDWALESEDYDNAF